MYKIFKNLDLGEGADTIRAISRKWGAMLYLSDEGNNDIAKIYRTVREKVKRNYCAEELKDVNVDNYEVQKDWLIMRGIIINVFHKKQLLENELLITNQEIKVRFQNNFFVFSYKPFQNYEFFCKKSKIFIVLKTKISPTSRLSSYRAADARP